MPANNPTACLLVIGNEVLSGRTQDANIRFLAVHLGELGIPLREVRVIPDIAETIRRLRAKRKLKASKPVPCNPAAS